MRLSGSYSGHRNGQNQTFIFQKKQNVLVGTTITTTVLLLLLLIVMVGFGEWGLRTENHHT